MTDFSPKNMMFTFQVVWSLLAFRLDFMDLQSIINDNTSLFGGGFQPLFKETNLISNLPD